MKLFAPAKVNLFLKVSGKRPDGYHALATLYERVALFDEIEIRSRKKKGIRVRTNCPELPQGPANFAHMAAKLLIEECGIRRGVSIRIKKRIPLEAGLGGGSSNAASVLLGLNQFWKLGLSQQKLQNLGSRLGSDVSFFILNKPFAIGKGRGEILKPLKRQECKIWHCLIKPNFGISTKKAYLRLDKKPESARRVCLTHPMADAKMLLLSIQKHDSKRLSNYLVNTLELSLDYRDTRILDLKKKLMDLGAIGALMAGSGSSVFGIFPSKKEAQKAACFLKKDRRLQIFVVSTY
jgi:4-diphosphocytidyl-2-C-methyl-D-erythritol kinase